MWWACLAIIHSLDASSSKRLTPGLADDEKQKHESHILPPSPLWHQHTVSWPLHVCDWIGHVCSCSLCFIDRFLQMGWSNIHCICQSEVPVALFGGDKGQNTYRTTFNIDTILMSSWKSIFLFCTHQKLSKTLSPLCLYRFQELLNLNNI